METIKCSFLISLLLAALNESDSFAQARGQRELNVSSSTKEATGRGSGLATTGSATSITGHVTTGQRGPDGSCLFISKYGQ